MFYLPVVLEKYVRTYRAQLRFCDRAADTLVMVRRGNPKQLRRWGIVLFCAAIGCQPVLVEVRHGSHGSCFFFWGSQTLITSSLFFCVEAYWEVLGLSMKTCLFTLLCSTPLVYVHGVFR